MTNFGNGFWLIRDEGSWVAGANPELVDILDFDDLEKEYWIVTIAHIEKAGNWGGDYSNIPGGTSLDLSMEEGNDLYKVNGTFQGTTFTLTQDKENYLDTMFRNQSSLSDATLYMVQRWSANLYKKFPDQDRSLQKFVPVRFMSKPKTKIKKTVLEFSMLLRSMWGT